jgi:hypothetical protein
MADDYRLAAGPHRRPGTGRCAMEWVAHIAGEPHTDAPRAVSPVLAAFARTLNDALDDDARQRLRPYLARMIGTSGDGWDPWRTEACAEWLAGECAPAMLAHAGVPARDVAAARARARRAEPDRVDGARHATRAAARTAGWDAALAAVRAGGGDEERAHAALRIVRDATWVAAWRDGPSPWERMGPVALALRRSAFALLDRLLVPQQATSRWNGSSVGSAPDANVFVFTSTVALSGAVVPPLATLTVAASSGVSTSPGVEALTAAGVAA